MATTIVLITGANSGVGYSATKVIASASEKYHVIMACRSPEKAAAAKKELEATGNLKGKLSTVELETTDQASIDAAAKTVEQQFGKLDVLINNAAIGYRVPDTKDRFVKTFTTNVAGPAMVAETFRPLLLKSSGSPCSIYISSGQGSLSRVTGPPVIERGEAYMSSKSALNMVMLQEHHSFQDKGLRTFAVCPGFVVSNLRGTSEEARSGWGRAGDPDVAGETILGVMEGKRDGEAGRLVHKDGVYDW